MKLEFIGQGMRDGDNIAGNTSRLVNCYREPTGAGDFCVKSVLGMSEFAHIGAVFVKAMAEIGGRVYAFCGNTLWRMDSTGLITEIGPVATGSSATITGNNGKVVVTVGGRLFVWNGSSLFEPSTGAFPNIGAAEYVSNYTVVAERGGRRFGWSDIADPATYPGLNFSTADGRDDDIVRPFEINGSLYILKEKSHEVWYVTGSAGAEAFQRASGGVYDVGLKSFGLVCRFIGSAFMVGSDGRAHVFAGGSLRPVSTPAVETAISTKTPQYCISYEDEGHTFCAIVFRDCPAWVYDVATGEWHERAEGADFQPWSATSSVKLGGSWLIGRNTGYVDKLTRSNADRDNPLQHEAVSKTLDFDGKRPIIREIEAFIRQGFSESQIGLFLSRDRGLTWGLEKIKGTGPVGEYENRVIWRNLGQFRHVTAKIRWTSPANTNLSSTFRVQL